MIQRAARQARFGFFGKIPSRGDFVRARLPRLLVEAWDGWLQRVMPAAERELGRRWNTAWQVAPVWRFALPAGQCGPRPLLGLWLPSVDRVGRRFPLMIAAETMAGDGSDDLLLDAAEQIGRDAVAHDLTPDAMLSCLDAAEPSGRRPEAACAVAGRWWSDGGPLVEAAALRLTDLPDAPTFTAMLHR